MTSRPGREREGGREGGRGGGREGEKEGEKGEGERREGEKEGGREEGDMSSMYAEQMKGTQEKRIKWMKEVYS